jgi:hypothetical protein
MKDNGISSGQRLDNCGSWFPKRLIIAKDVIYALALRLLETGCKRGAILNRLSGTLCHIGKHWMAGITQKCPTGNSCSSNSAATR